MTILSTREVNQDLGRAKKAAAKGPVIITDRGKPAHVLLNIEEYRRLSGTVKSVVESLASNDAANLEDFIPARSIPSRGVDFS